MTTRDVKIAVIGSGFAGLGMAIQLRQRGETDFVVLERADEVGGTWRDNHYPGAACDVQSNLYSFSFAPNPDWPRSYSEQPEIQAYLENTAARYGVYEHTVFGADVTAARWDDDAHQWIVSTTAGEFRAQVLISAAGALADPTYPDIPGLQSFEGELMHSARWDDAVDLDGTRVAVIGTGASAIQVVPAIQPRVASIAVYQRTAPWIVPRSDRPVKRSAQFLYRHVPLFQKAVRGLLYLFRELLVVGMAKRRRMLKPVQKVARAHLERQVRDPELRRKLTPSYRIGCKRILLSNDYYPALTRDNVEVVTDAIREVREHAIVTADGREHEVDTIIFGTGFHVTDMPIGERVRGRDGRRLVDAWGGSPKAHLGTIVHGFPNLFLLLGPNTGLGHNSVVYMMEAQVGLVVAALRHLRATGAAAIEPRAEVQAAFVAEMGARARGTVWTSGGCHSWYLDATGRNSTLWPGSSYTFAKRLSKLRPEEYALTPPPVTAPEREPALA